MLLRRRVHLMKRSFVVAFSFAACLLTASPKAQGAPIPAPESKQLAPIVGSWHGKGTMSEPSGQKTKWTATASFRWVLDGHWMQEDLVFRFEGMEVPFQVRGYVGYDREHARFVSVSASSDGKVEFEPVTVQKDAVLAIAARQQGPMAYAQRTVWRRDGDALVHTVDMLLTEGASFAIAEGRFERTRPEHDANVDVDLGAKAFMNSPAHADLQRLCRMQGAYDVEGTMVPAPGVPAMAIRGVDTFRAIFGGTVLHGHTDGTAEGMDGRYEAVVCWARDDANGGLVGVHVSNHGEVGRMQALWSEDGSLIATSVGKRAGQPVLQRMRMEFDEKGAAKTAVGHSIVGASDSAETFRARYAKTKD